MRGSLWPVVVGLALAAGSRPAAAGPIAWSYRAAVQYPSGGGPAAAAGTQPNGRGTADFQPVPGGTAWAAGSELTVPVATIALNGTSLDPLDYTATFTPGANAYHVDVTIRDDASGETGTVQFDGGLLGSFGYTGSTPDTRTPFVALASAPAGAVGRRLTLGGHLYAVTILPFVFPTTPTLYFRHEDYVVPIARGDVGQVPVLVNVTDAPAAPEPASLTLAGLGLAAVAGLARRRRPARCRNRARIFSPD